MFCEARNSILRISTYAFIWLTDLLESLLKTYRIAAPNKRFNAHLGDNCKCTKWNLRDHLFTALC